MWIEVRRWVGIVTIGCNLVWLGRLLALEDGVSYNKGVDEVHNVHITINVFGLLRLHSAVIEVVFIEETSRGTLEKLVSIVAENSYSQQ